MDIEFPDLLGLGSKEIIVFKKLPDLEQKVRVHQVDLIAGTLCLFLQILAVVFQNFEHGIAGIKIII